MLFSAQEPSQHWNGAKEAHRCPHWEASVAQNTLPETLHFTPLVMGHAQAADDSAHSLFQHRTVPVGHEISQRLELATHAPFGQRIWRSGGQGQSDDTDLQLPSQHWTRLELQPMQASLFAAQVPRRGQNTRPSRHGSEQTPLYERQRLGHSSSYCEHGLRWQRPAVWLNQHESTLVQIATSLISPQEVGAVVAPVEVPAEYSSQRVPFLRQRSGQAFVPWYAAQGKSIALGSSQLAPFQRHMFILQVTLSVAL
jgi:hypothetical protein